MAYATVADLEARWKTLDSAAQAVAEVKLADAAVLIDSFGVPKSADAAKAVSCSVVMRAMSSMATDALGVTQASITAGSYQQQWTYSNPSGDMYLTKQEMKMLGFGGGSLGFARPSYGALEAADG